MQVDLTHFNGATAYAQYTTFSIGDNSTEYTLNIGGNYTGTAGDTISMTYNNGMKFTTYDNDNDQWPQNCAHSSNCYGAWWYKDCTYCNLNGYYYTSAIFNSKSIFWYSWAGVESLKAAEMKVKHN